MLNVIQEATNVRIEHPVHPLPLDAHCQGVKRLMRAATRTEPVRKALKVGLVNLIEDRHHSLLNNLVLHCCDAQWAFPPIGLRYVDSSRRLGPIRSTVHPAMKITKVTFQPGFIL